MVEWCTGLNEAGADLLSYQNRAALAIVGGVSKTALPTLPPLLLLATRLFGKALSYFYSRAREIGLSNR